MKDSNVKNKSVIIGLGKTGLSVAKYFSAKGLAFKVMDTRHDPPMLEDFKKRFNDVEIETGKLNINSLVFPFCLSKPFKHSDKFKSYISSISSLVTRNGPIGAKVGADFPLIH